MLTVLVLVDLQNAAFGGYGIPPAHQADLLLQNAHALLQAARASGVPVVHIQHCAGPGEAFEEGGPGWPIAPRLAPRASELVVRKRASNAFEDTDLHQVLRELGASDLVVTGIQSDRCVGATCRGALALGYGVRLSEDGHSTWPDGARSAAEIIAAQNEALGREGVVLSHTERLVEWLHASRRSTTVETEHLLLRPWREDDRVELERLLGDPAVRGVRSFPPDRIGRLGAHSLRQWSVNGFGPWAAIEKASGSWIGRIGLDELEGWPDVDRIEVGFELHKAWWGRGLATEGAVAALRFGFEQHGLERIISVTAASHAAARRVMEKAGLTYRSTRTWMNPDVPVVCYAIDRATWQAGRRLPGA